MKVNVRHFLISIYLSFLMVFHVVAEERTWKINMKDADIKAFIAQVSEITGETFVVDPRVKGDVTVISQQALPASGVYELMRSVLRVHRFSVAKSDGVVKIVPEAQARENSSTSSALKGEAFVTRVIQVDSVPVKRLIPVLRPLVPNYAHLAAVPEANSLVISDHAGNVARVMKIIQRIEDTGEDEVEVVQLEHAWVGEVVSMLESLTPNEVQSGKGGDGGGRARVVADERTNRLIIRGDKLARARIALWLEKFDQPGKGGGDNHVLRLRHANAKLVAEILNGLLKDKQATEGKGKVSIINRASIQPDESLNALVVSAAPSMMVEVAKLVEQLDVRRAQVLIEAAIVEVSGNARRALGVQWGFGNEEDGVAGINFNNGGLLSLNDVVAAVRDPDNSRGLSEGITLAGGGRSGDKIEYGVLVQALATSTHANLLSTPSIVTMDNEEATITVGQNVPFITGSTSSDNNNNPFQTIERQDVGLKLKVKPQINDGDTIRLEVEQEVSSVLQSVEGVDSADLITSKRAIETIILADNLETLVLGGLIQDDIQDTISKVPLLGDIPLLGALFRTTSKTHVKRNLLVFLRPSIIRTQADAAEITANKYTRMKEINLSVGIDGSIVRIEDQLPERIGHMFDYGRQSDESNVSSQEDPE